MNVESNINSHSNSREILRWKQMADEEKKAAVTEGIEKMRRLPPNSAYASHRLRVLNKIHNLLSLQRSTSQDEELELLFSGLHL